MSSTHEEANALWATRVAEIRQEAGQRVIEKNRHKPEYISLIKEYALKVIEKKGEERCQENTKRKSARNRSG